MLEMIFEAWSQGTFWDKAFICYGVIVCFVAICFIVINIKHRPKKKLGFIVNANKNGCLAVGKMTCLTLHGSGSPSYYQAEYMYFVDGKRYFVTYQMMAHVPIDNRKDEMNADMLLLKLKPVMILFYDKKDPTKVMSKIEVFTSSDGIHQVPTPKSNVWRNTEKDWTEPIDLISY